ncbi:MAG: EF-hand domain-containing protein, partial [Stackebrandtia sp.]
AYLQMWDVIAQQSGISSKGDLDKDAYIEAAERTVLEQGDKGFAEVVRPTIRAIADMCDTDGSGQISTEEWKRWAKAIGMSPQQATEAFRAIDSDHSGQLSTEELVQAVNDYHAGRTDVELLG